MLICRFVAAVRADLKKLNDGCALHSILKGYDEKTLIDFDALRGLGHVVQGMRTIQSSCCYVIANILSLHRSRMLLYSIQSTGPSCRLRILEVPDQAAGNVRRARVCRRLRETEVRDHT